MKQFDAPSPKIKLPPSEPITSRELERRRRVVARILERRRKIGPIGIRAQDLVREVREEAERG